MLQGSIPPKNLPKRFSKSSRLISHGAYIHRSETDGYAQSGVCFPNKDDLIIKELQPLATGLICSLDTVLQLRDSGNVSGDWEP